MNNYFKIFLTVVVVVATGFLMSLAYSFLRMADTAFNAGGALLITGTALGAYWCLYQLWVKSIPRDEKISFGKEKRAEGEQEKK